jgi:hypothetical protein
LTEAGIGGAKHCIFHVRLECDKDTHQTVDFAAASPAIVRQWVNGLSILQHIGSVGIGLQVKQSGGKFVALVATEGSPSALCRLLCPGDVIEAVDTFPLTTKTTLDEYEALVLGVDGSPISLMLERQGAKVCLVL